MHYIQYVYNILLLLLLVDLLNLLPRLSLSFFELIELFSQMTSTPKFAIFLVKIKKKSYKKILCQVQLLFLLIVILFLYCNNQYINALSTNPKQTSF